MGVDKDMTELQSSFSICATMVANEFIDQYMAAASGEYVKVYLYLLRHQDRLTEVASIADALNHTEADVRRALAYWERLGVLKARGKEEDGREAAAAGAVSSAGEAEAVAAAAAAKAPGKAETAGLPAPAADRRAKVRPVYTPDQVSRLAGDEEFSQLLYIAQKYLNKVFTQREGEVLAYLYDGLHMSFDLLEYLLEYCVQGGHTSIRYIETVALNWHEKELDTVEKAKAYASGFMKDSFAVMKAFGLSDRHPGEAEKEMITRWVQVYGFTRELIVEACNRTLRATHNPSFPYADKILSEWRKEGVKSMQDVEALDQKRARSQSQNKTRKKEQGTANRFHNFEQRDTNYDSLVLEQVKSWIGEQ